VQALVLRRATVPGHRLFFASQHRFSECAGALQTTWDRLARPCQEGRPVVWQGLASRRAAVGKAWSGDGYIDIKFSLQARVLACYILDLFGGGHGIIIGLRA
jgi:hypothetical protein